MTLQVAEKMELETDCSAANGVSNLNATSPAGPSIIVYLLAATTPQLDLPAASPAAEKAAEEAVATVVVAAAQVELCFVLAAQAPAQVAATQAVTPDYNLRGVV